MFNRYDVTASNAAYITAYSVACGSYFEKAYEKLTKKIYNLTRVSNKKRWQWARARVDKEYHKQQAANALDLRQLAEKYPVHIETSDKNFNYNFYYITHALSNSVIIKKIDQLIRMRQVDPSIAASYKTRLLMYQIRRFEQKQSDIEKLWLQRDDDNREKKAASRKKMAKLLLNVFDKIHRVDSSSASILYKHLYLFDYVFQKKSAEEVAGFFKIASNRAEQFKNKINYMVAIKSRERRPIYRRPLPIMEEAVTEERGLFSWFFEKIAAVFHWLGVKLSLLPEPVPPSPIEIVVPAQPIQPEEKEIAEPPMFLHDSPEDVDVKDEEHESDNDEVPVKRKVSRSSNGNVMIMKLLETCELQEQKIKALEEKLKTITQTEAKKEIIEEDTESRVRLKLQIEQNADEVPLCVFKDARPRRRQDRRMTLPQEVHRSDSDIGWVKPIKVVEVRTSPNEADLRRANTGCAS